MSQRVAFLGLGIMGSRMARNLVRAGFELTVYNRTEATARQFVNEHGGTVAGTPAAAAENAELVVTMVVDGAQVEQLLLGEDGVIGTAGPGTLSSTARPSAQPPPARSQRGLPNGTSGWSMRPSPDPPRRRRMER